MSKFPSIDIQILTHLIKTIKGLRAKPTDLQSAFVAGAEFATCGDLSIFKAELEVIKTEAARMYPKGECDDD